MPPGEVTPEDLAGRLTWLSHQGTLTVTKEDYPWSRQGPWQVTVELGAMEDSHIRGIGDDLFVVAGDVIAGVRTYWRLLKGNGPWGVQSIGGVVFNDQHG